MSLFPPFSTRDPVGYHVIVGVAPVSPRGLAMTYDTINVTPVTPRIGANIEGITLARPLTNRQVDELHQALAEHQVLFFRNQPMDIEAHKRFGRYFGELHIHPNTPGPEGHPEILPIHADANSKRVSGEYWHSDVSCDEEPPLGSILYLHTIPSSGGDTLFASQYAAYDTLSPRMKVYLEGLTATHSGDHVYRRTNVLVGRDDKGKVFPRASHPVVRTHPVTKRKALFVNGHFTTHINELPEEEGSALLQFLCKHSTREEFQVRFRWEPHSVAFWDNRSVQHLAIWDYYPQVRSGRRVTIKGDRPS
jgi:alpha-ketoglutarate-dependent taurine dioxygenase